MPILLDPAGREVPFGPVYRRREWSSLEGALPSWLTSSTATTFSDPASTLGQATLSTSAVADNLSWLRGSQSFALSIFKALKLTVVGLSYAPKEAVITMGFTNAFSGSTRGAQVVDVFDGDLGTSAYFRSYGASPAVQTQDVDYCITSRLESAKRRNLSFLLLPASKEMYLMEGDQEFGYFKDPLFDIPSTGSTAVFPYLTCKTQAAAIVGLSFQGVTLELWN